MGSRRQLYITTQDVYCTRPAGVPQDWSVCAGEGFKTCFVAGLELDRTSKNKSIK